jgi:protein TonB
LANELGLSGRQRIYVKFKIDKFGDVVDVIARAPHPKLEEEAVKVITSLPHMIPGKQRGVPVGVVYSLPIIFRVEEL